MKPFAVCAGLLVLLLLGPGRADDGHRGRVVPDEAFTAIVRDATQRIGATLRKGHPRTTYIDLRVNALVIALAADNRLLKKDPAAVALRDAALHLVDGLEMHYTSRDWVLGHAALKSGDNAAIHAELRRRFAALERWPEKKAGAETRFDRYRLSSRFSHEDVAFFFGGCGGSSGHKVESDLLRITGGGLKQPELEAMELLGYKVALVGDLLRDYDGHSTSFRGPPPEPRKLWLNLSVDLEQAAWDLAASARSKHLETTRQAVQKLETSCTACHLKAGFRNSQ